MKNLKSFMLLFSIALILGAVLVGSCTAQEPMNYLKLKGKVVSDNTTDIHVYSFNEVSSEWEKIESKYQKKKYSLRLSTSLEYQVHFMADNGSSKTMYIQPGEEGMWITYLDVDFNKTNSTRALLCQNNENDNYDVTLMPYAVRNSE